MTDRELRRMSRGELLELLVAQMEENQSIRQELEQARAELADRTIRMEEAGSIAQAALALNGVFESAERAAAQYAENLNRQAREEARQIIEDARAYARSLRQESQEETE